MSSSPSTTFDLDLEEFGGTAAAVPPPFRLGDPMPSVGAAIP